MQSGNVLYEGGGCYESVCLMWKAAIVVMQWINVYMWCMMWCIMVHSDMMHRCVVMDDIINSCIQ